MERDFKGIWIPKEIRLAKDINVMEKLFLVEIHSLDNTKGCFASNAYFSEFFGISKGRCTQIIKSLESKKYVSVELEREGKNITKRVVRILNTLFNKLNTPLSKTKHPYLENDEDNNTLYNNTINKKLEDFGFSSKVIECIFDYNKSRRKKLQKLTEKGFLGFCNKLKRFGINDKGMIEVLNESIINGWEGIFELKTNKGKQKTPETYNGRVAYLNSVESIDENEKYELGISICKFMRLSDSRDDKIGLKDSLLRVTGMDMYRKCWEDTKKKIILPSKK